jgi:hypothetical protein
MRTFRVQTATNNACKPQAETGDYRKTAIFSREVLAENRRYPGGPDHAPHIPSEEKIALHHAAIGSLRRLLRQAERMADKKKKREMFERIYKLIDFHHACVFRERDPVGWRAPRMDADVILEEIMRLLPAKEPVRPVMMIVRRAVPTEKEARTNVFQLYLPLNSNSPQPALA